MAKVSCFGFKDKRITFDSSAKLMGVVNITPDSFYDGGRYFDMEAAVDRIFELVSNGTSIIDIGGESSRPNAFPVSTEEELGRILPVIRVVRGKISVPISVDTYKSAVARIVLEEGVDIINDISALRFDPLLPEVIAEHKAGVILMHMQGVPRNMQDNPYYDDVVKEIRDFLRERIEFAVSCGISEENIMIDPGIGFGKRLEDNLLIFKNIDSFKKLDRPLLIGPSRKTFIGEITGKDPGDRIFGTAGVIAYCALKGIDLIRVHDIPKMMDVIDMVHAIRRAV